MDVDETSSESTNGESVSTGSPQSAGIPDVFVINSDDLIQSGIFLLSRMQEIYKQ